MVWCFVRILQPKSKKLWTSQIADAKNVRSNEEEKSDVSYWGYRARELGPTNVLKEMTPDAHDCVRITSEFVQRTMKIGLQKRILFQEFWE